MIDPINSKNVALIKDANGKDIEKIYNKYGNLVFKNWNTLEGPFPIGCFTSSNKLRNYRIYGNTIQDGTPEPEFPGVVEVQGCGEQTENLFDKDTAVVYSAWIQSNGSWSYASDSRSVRIRVKPNTQYTLSTEGTYTIFRILEVQSDDVPTEQNKYLQIPSIIIMRGENQSHYTFKTSENAKYIVFQSNLSVVNQWLNELMLVEGDSVRSYYIPYGYKIPVMVAEQPHILFTETVDEFVQRGASWSIKNGVVSVTGTATGQSNPISLMKNRAGMSGDFLITKNNKNTRISISCLIVKNGVTSYNNLDSILRLDGTETRVSFFPQVQAGTYNNTCTPTIQQVITTPVYIGSEPLHKIDDYADYVDYKRGVIVRHIKKAVLTGDENWIDDAHNENRDVYRLENFANFRIFSISGYNVGIFRCTHILYMYPYPSSLYDRIVLFDDNVHQHTLYFSTKKSMGLDTVDKFKSFLAKQYEIWENPVTIWYIAAEPEEEVLPLSQKIPTNIGSNTFSCTISPAPSKAMIQYKKK
jgi:hypothetical protein